MQPSGTGTHTSPLAVEGSTLKYCAGVPTPKENVDQFPSTPAHCELGSMIYGTGNVESISETNEVLIYINEMSIELFTRSKDENLAQDRLFCGVVVKFRAFSAHLKMHMLVLQPVYSQVQKSAARRITWTWHRGTCR